MFDDVAIFNQRQWDELARHGVLYSRPLLDLTPETTREWLDPHNLLGDLTGRAVLCLASGGGKQSAAFGVLGAQVSVLDFSAQMLRGDQRAAEHYGYPVDLRQGDMRDLTPFANHQFDWVWQPYALNYIPDPLPVFQEVARVLKPGGRYHLQIHNPFYMGMHAEQWTGAGYPISLPYTDSEVADTPWSFEDESGQTVSITAPRAFRHTLGRVVNGLAGLGFNLIALYEHIEWNPDGAPGSWDHFTHIAPPWLNLFFAFRPGDSLA